MPASYKGRIAFFYPWGNLGSFSSLQDALIMLVEHGFWVDFYTQKDESFPSSEMNLSGLSIINRPEAFLFIDPPMPQLILRLKKGGRAYRWLMINIIYPVIRGLTFKGFLRRRHKMCAYHFFFGMDPEGLASAAMYAKLLNVPFAYWSLELLFAKEINSQEKKHIKKLEIIHNKQAIFTIVQDHWRGQTLVEENGIDPTRMFFVPNAPRGKARREKNDYLHKRLHIPLERKIILCAGTVDSWSMSAEIVAATANWPDEYILVMQSRRRKNVWSEKYINRVLELADPKKVIISFMPVPQVEYRNFVDSADVGLAFYTPDTSKSYMAEKDNIRLLGLSSGKIAGYLYSGLPVIVNNAVIGPKELVQSSDCGYCVSQPESIKEALSVIFKRYDWYVINACRCFDENLELEKHFSPIVKRVELLSNKDFNFLNLRQSDEET